MTYAFAAAGTGGHVYPALAIADELVARGVERADIVFFGGDRMEATAVPAAGYRFCGVEIRGLRRSLSVDNLTLPGLVRRAARHIAAELAASHTRVVTALGGYVSVPAALATRRARARLFLHEQNAAPGLANRFIARWATTSFVAFPAAAPRLPRSQVVGNPVRKAFTTFDRAALREEARKRYDLPLDVTVLGVLGGSLGARVLNETTQRIADDLDPRRMAIIHLTGAEHHDAVRSAAERSGLLWRTVPFEQEMEHFYAAVDLVLGRAGALTISELAATGTASVVVPLAAVAQEGNAAFLAAAEAAVLVPEVEIDRVPVEIGQLLVDEARRRTMADRAAGLARTDAASQVATALMEAAQ